MRPSYLAPYLSRTGCVALKNASLSAGTNWMPAALSFAVASPLPEKELLMETDPDTFWETPHYRGWPAVLVRFGGADRERIENVIVRAWWDRLKKPQRTAFGPRP